VNPRRRALALALSVATLSVGTIVSEARAQESPAPARDGAAAPPSHVIGSGDVFGRLAPAGTAVLAGIRYQRVFGYDEKERYETSYVQAGAALLVCPPYLEPGLSVELLPVPFLVLRAEGNLFRFNGMYQGLLRFPTAKSAFGDAQLESLSGKEQEGWAERGLLSATVRLKFGPVVIRSETAGALYHFEDPGPYLYESEYDTLLAPTDGIIDNRSQVLFQIYRGSGDATLLVGPAYEVTRAVTTKLNRERVGGAAYFVPVDAWGGIRRPHAFFYSGVNVTDPNRTGAPFAVLGIGAEIE
jgi:hypothetical protein